MTAHNATAAYELTLPYFNSALEYYIAPDQATLVSSEVAQCNACVVWQGSSITFYLPQLEVMHLHLTCNPCKHNSGARWHMMHWPGSCFVQNFSDFRDGEVLSTLTPAANLTVYVNEINGTESVYIESYGTEVMVITPPAYACNVNPSCCQSHGCVTTAPLMHMTRAHLAISCELHACLARR